MCHCWFRRSHQQYPTVSKHRKCRVVCFIVTNCRSYDAVFIFDKWNKVTICIYTYKSNPGCWVVEVEVKKLWPGEESGASTAAARVTWPSCLLLADWSVLAGNKNINFLAFSKFTFYTATSLNRTPKRVFAEIVGPRRRRFAYTGLWEMSYEFFFSVVLFPGEQCRDGIVLRSEAFFFTFHTATFCSLAGLLSTCRGRAWCNCHYR